uniref:helix-turn-helix transcriptional regulator n=1 Tax=Marinobacterium rhizophilum TaxID=420402 RepID=UPI00037A034D
LLSLIDAIYAAAADPSLWPFVARQIQSAIGGHSVNFMFEDLSDSRVNSVYSNGVSEAQIAKYQQDVMTQDSFTAIYEQMEPGTSFVSQDYFDRKALHSLYCYEGFYETIGYANFNAGLFYKDDRRRGWLSVVRSESDPLYTRDECLLMQTLTPHLKRAFMINVQLLEAQLTSKVALDSLEHIAAATMLLTKNGKVMLHNSRAESYLHPTGAATKQLSFRLPDVHANHHLHILIGAIGRGPTPDEKGVVPFIEKGVQKTALCLPWRSSDEQFDWLGKTTCCIVFILSPSADAPHEDMLHKTFDLSKAEVKVLQRLMSGMQVAEVAGYLFVSEATVRFHIRNLLRKTASRNQAEMITRVFNTTSVRVE